MPVSPTDTISFYDDSFKQTTKEFPASLTGAVAAAHVKCEQADAAAPAASPLRDIVLPLLEPLSTGGGRRFFYINSNPAVGGDELPLVIKSTDLIKKEEVEELVEVEVEEEEEAEADYCLADLDRLTDLLQVPGGGGRQHDCWESASAMSTVSSSNSSHFEFSASELELDMLPASLQEDYDWMDNIMRI